MHSHSRRTQACTLLALATALALAGCKKQEEAAAPAAPAAAQQPPAAAPAAVADTDSEFASNAANPDNWGGIGRDFGLTRHSPLSEINRDTVKNLKMSWEMKTDATRGHEGQPLVIGS
ncbi:MAG: PQQ-dependent dehydrogenase, methanol/ethanol family, partial [Xanthomonas sp.]